MRFGLALTLMSDGYFSHELGDTDHGQDWWYDELDFTLGMPLGPARRIPMGHAVDRELMENGGFESDLAGTWSLWCDTRNGCAATAERDTSVNHSGTAAARVTITGAGRKGGIEFTQPGRVLEQGKSYDLTFWARASHPLEVLAIASKASPNKASCTSRASRRHGISTSLMTAAAGSWWQTRCTCSRPNGIMTVNPRGK